jgi:histidyl-tRNA synthetase
MLARLWKKLGLAGIELQVNSIGDAADRKEHRAKLVGYFERHAQLLDEDAKRRLHTNPLRILDSKNPAMQDMIEGAPKLLEHLGEGARRHFDALQELLQNAGIAYRVNPRLVRGMDYYNRTVFEFVAGNIGAQSTVAGGGRYDGLFEQLGGKATPACGFGMGIERMMLVLQALGVNASEELDAFVVYAGDGAQRAAWQHAERLRDLGLRVVMGPGGKFGTQMKKADASGARYALIVGEDEVKAQRVTLKPLRGGGSQETLAVDEVLRRLKQQCNQI